MAKVKSSSAQKGVTISGEAHSALMEFMASTDRRIAAAADSAERLAKMEADRQIREDYIGRLTNADMRAIENRLCEVLQSCAAINRLAIDSYCSTDICSADHFMKAIEEMARANVKGLDACISKIAGAAYSGLFENELELAEETE